MDTVNAPTPGASRVDLLEPSAELGWGSNFSAYATASIRKSLFRRHRSPTFGMHDQGEALSCRRERLSLPEPPL